MPHSQEHQWIWRHLHFPLPPVLFCTEWTTLKTPLPLTLSHEHRKSALSHKCRILCFINKYSLEYICIALFPVSGTKSTSQIFFYDWSENYRRVIKVIKWLKKIKSNDSQQCKLLFLGTESGNAWGETAGNGGGQIRWRPERKVVVAFWLSERSSRYWHEASSLVCQNAALPV